MAGVVETLRPGHSSVFCAGEDSMEKQQQGHNGESVPVVTEHLICALPQSTLLNPHYNPLRWLFYPHFADKEAKDQQDYTDPLRSYNCEQ